MPRKKFLNETANTPTSTMELVSPITEVVTRAMNCSTKHFNYLHALDTNLDKLEQEMAQLNERKSDVNHNVIAEATNTQTSTMELVK
ncbi:hypothetical protein FRX31_032417 [Thalictrum thalictroides]|uniref:Uncharacterized protein n=1 Tax=Thalictrum thalictroides TaxID=46969 RepID=A0A7J6V185_THATH|nr:hypothetical protein FRX31_032417 [Thalictrum thalictroides]